MARRIGGNSVTGGAALRGRYARLALDEIDSGPLWSVQGNRELGLSALVAELFPAVAQQGNMLCAGGLRLLRPWPQQAYLLSHRQALASELSRFDALLTDISHGFCQFRLGGDPALAFLASYTSADLEQVPRQSACLRCLLGQYPVTLWWDDPSDVRMLLERSLAQSFYDYLGSLLARWQTDVP